MLLALLLVVACGGPAPTASPGSSPTPAIDGAQGLIGDLADAGADAFAQETFDGAPLAAQAELVCVNGEEVRVYGYSSAEERAAAAARIDPNDPSNVGTAIIDWVGWPRFWERDRILVLYAGRDEATIDLLVSVMGDPFAVGQGRPPLRPDDGCARGIPSEG